MSTPTTRATLTGSAGRSTSAGYTLIEVMVGMVIAAIMMGLAVVGFSRWAAAESQAGAATTLQTVMRQSQVRAVTEGVSICVKFNTAAKSYEVFRYACNTSPLVHIAGPFTLDGDQSFTSLGFTAPDGSTSTGVTFSPSGTAWRGSVTITRTGSTKTYRIDVEGLTGRVSLG